MINALVDSIPRATEIQPFSGNLEIVSRPHSEDNRVENPFSAFFGAALEMVEDTNAIVASAEQMQLDFATGRMDDILAVQMAMSRANDAITFTSQVTNRIIESYREIMRMQI